MKCERIPLGAQGAYLDTYFLADSPELKAGACRPAVVVCPGGGYAYTSDREAEPIALALCARGFHACVLRYPCAPARFPAALRALARDKCVVIPGFYGLMPDGKLRTLTRGGSDITGALAAAALDADVYENWTDVSGILMADPRIVDHPRSIERATYSELRQLSYSGAQVLHEMTIFPVREKNIPLNIRNTNEPDHPGTLITESFVEAPNPERFVTGIAGKCDFSIVTVSKKGLSGAVGTLRAILEVFENNSIPVAHTPSGIDCISLAMPTEALTPNQYSLLDELRSEIRPDSIQINDHIAVIAVVGRKMAFRVGTSGKIFAALGKAGINIRMISQGPDEQAIILGVDNKDYADAIRVLYNAFVK